MREGRARTYPVRPAVIAALHPGSRLQDSEDDRCDEQHRRPAYEPAIITRFRSSQSFANLPP